MWAGVCAEQRPSQGLASQGYDFFDEAGMDSEEDDLHTEMLDQVTRGKREVGG